MVFFAKIVNTLELLKFLQNSPSYMFQRVLKTPLTLNENCYYFEFFWSVFSCIQIEYGELLCKSQNAFHIRGNTHHKNSKYGYADIDVKSVKHVVIPASYATVTWTFVWTITALFCAITSPLVKDTTTVITMKFRTYCSLWWLCSWGCCRWSECCEITATNQFKPSTWFTMVLINYNSHKSCLYRIL